MPVKIRLARHGRKRRPIYSVVVSDSRAPRDGKYIERIGQYNPNTNPASIDLNFDKALDWLQKGAQPTDTARAILSDQGVMYKKHLLGGIKKGALTEEQVEAKFNEWISAKESKRNDKIQGLQKEKVAQKNARLAEEAKISEARAQDIAKRKFEIEEQAKAEEAAAENAEETTAEVAPEAQAEEAPVAETEAPAEETPAAEAAPEVEAEKSVEEAPEAKATETEEKPAEEAPEEDAKEKSAE